MTLSKVRDFKRRLDSLSTASVEAKYPLDISFAPLSKDIHWMSFFTLLGK